MRLFPLIIAAAVSVVLYLVVFERDRLQGAPDETAATEQPVAAEAEAASIADEAERIVSVVAMRSKAINVDSAVVLRGRTEAARQVDVRSETTGLVNSEPLRKGAYVEQGQLLCEIDPGTRLTALAEAEARLPEAQSRLPEAQGRLAEAEARLAEARINDNAAKQLSEDGFASSTRVAATRAAVQSALAGVETAKAGVEGSKAGVQAAEAAIAAARKEIDRLNVSAPFSGLLETDTAELGL